jgi:glycosyltransferase involved in cell wall biosynthesis
MPFRDPSSAHPRRVLQVVTRMNVGGMTHQVLTLCEQLRERGWEVAIVTGRVAPREGDCRHEAVERGFTVHELPTLSNAIRPLADLRALVALCRLFRRERPAVVHVYMFKARLLAGIAARLARVPVVLETLHGNLLDGYFSRVATAVIRVAERLIGRFLVDRVIAPSSGQRTELLGYRIAPPGRILVQHVGFDAKPFDDLTPWRGRLRAGLDLPPAVLLVGVLGRLVPIKGIGDFLDAAAYLASDPAQAGLWFVVVGDGPMRDDLERHAAERGLAERCRFVGRIPDTREFYADVDVVVLSSWNEGSAIVLLEAMAAGNASVATAVGGVPDTVIDGETALLVPRQSPARLAKAIATVAGDPGLRARLGAAGRRRAAEFSPTALGESAHLLYNALLAEARRG